MTLSLSAGELTYPIEAIVSVVHEGLDYLRVRDESDMVC